MQDSKQLVREVLERLPDNCSIEDVQYHLYVAEVIRRRRETAAQGNVISQQDAESRLEKWLIN